MPHELPAAIRESMPRPSAVSTRSAVLAILIGLTSLAVGATTSPWLVPPYLGAMGWLLLVPARRPLDGEPSTTENATQQHVTSVSFPTAPEPAEDVSPAVEAAPKPKKPRRKAKAKAKDAPAALPTVATFVQVAPGKFVRVEVVVPLDVPPAEEPTEPTTPDADSVAEEPTQQATPDADPIVIDSEPVVSIEEASVKTESPPTTAEPEPESSPLPPIWGVESRSLPILIEPDPIEDHGPDEPPCESRLVATGGPARSGFGRPSHGRSIHFRLRRDPRPKARRGNGRVGASPRVVLHRA